MCVALSWPNRRHIHARRELGLMIGFADALLQDLFTDDVAVRQRKQQRGPQGIDIHIEHGENFYHLHAAPKQEIRLRDDPLRCYADNNRQVCG